MMALLEKITDRGSREPEKKKGKSASSSKVKSVKTKTKKISGVSAVTQMDYRGKDAVLVRPYITEKAARASEHNAYTFVIAPDANKVDVRNAVKALYGVEVRGVRIINLPDKRIVRRGKRGIRSGVRKAVVYLQEGNKIEFV